MCLVYARRDQILRAALESNAGYVVQVIGDAFCPAFGNAGDAVRAARKSQLELRARNGEMLRSTSTREFTLVQP
jgi:class 3 adenylate cyclase